VTVPNAPESDSSLAAMITALRDGQEIDKDALREALLKQAQELGVPGKLAGKVMGRARWEAERNRGDEEAG
jgi:hypothetical protein